jgi:hypothetical protein
MENTPAERNPQPETSPQPEPIDKPNWPKVAEPITPQPPKEGEQITKVVIVNQDGSVASELNLNATSDQQASNA